MMHVGSGELSHEDSSMTDTYSRTHGPFLERPLSTKRRGGKVPILTSQTGLCLYAGLEAALVLAYLRLNVVSCLDK